MFVLPEMLPQSNEAASTDTDEEVVSSAMEVLITDIPVSLDQAPAARAGESYVLNSFCKCPFCE